MEFKPLTTREIMLLHDMLVAQYGGAAGLRDKALLEGAIHRAESRLAYGSAEPGSLESLVDAAVAAGSGIVSSHPFVDANKRTALLVIRALLNLNGVVFSPPLGEEADAMVNLASGEWSEDVFKDWVLRNSVPRMSVSAHLKSQ
jgi:death-on-curing protein